jgi:hypothetical protein
VVKAGRKKKKTTEMYLLDRSTFRRIGTKQKRSHPTIIRRLKNELRQLPQPIDFLKKIFKNAIIFWWSMVSISPLKEKNIANIWPLIPRLV